MSFLNVIDKVDTFPYSGIGEYYNLLAHDGTTAIGYLTIEIVRFFEKQPTNFIVSHSEKYVKMSDTLSSFEDRNKVFAAVAQEWKALPEFDDCLAKSWRNELYTVHHPVGVPYILLERAFSVLLGVVTYGVHINGYVSSKNTSSNKLKLWIPRRSATKPTYPGKLDNTIAGGIGYPYGVWETLVKECFEEGGLRQDFVETHIKSTGVLLYMIQPNKFAEDTSSIAEGVVVQPEVEYVYDLEFENESDVVPYPEDGEAESFALLEVEEVIEKLHNGEFKPNCALVIVDFLIRHGYITAENEPNFHEIVSRIHRRLPFPLR